MLTKLKCLILGHRWVTWSRHRHCWSCGRGEKLIYNYDVLNQTQEWVKDVP